MNNDDYPKPYVAAINKARQDAVSAMSDSEGDEEDESFKPNFKTETSPSNLSSKDPMKKNGVIIHSLSFGDELKTMLNNRTPYFLPDDYAVDESTETSPYRPGAPRPTSHELRNLTQHQETPQTTHEKEETKLSPPTSPINQTLDKDGKTPISDVETHKQKKSLNLEECNKNFKLCGRWVSNKRLAQEAQKNVDLWDLLMSEGLGEKLEQVLMQSIGEK